jgi:hypothetical protein
LGVQVNITDSNFTGNSTTGNGGIYSVESALTLTNVTLSGNTGSAGGDIVNAGTTTVKNTLIADGTQGANGDGVFGVAPIIIWGVSFLRRSVAQKRNEHHSLLLASDRYQQFWQDQIRLVDIQSEMRCGRDVSACCARTVASMLK